MTEVNIGTMNVTERLTIDRVVITITHVPFTANTYPPWPMCYFHLIEFVDTGYLFVFVVAHMEWHCGWRSKTPSRLRRNENYNPEPMEPDLWSMEAIMESGEERSRCKQ